MLLKNIYVLQNFKGYKSVVCCNIIKKQALHMLLPVFLFYSAFKSIFLWLRLSL